MHNMTFATLAAIVSMLGVSVAAATATAAPLSKRERRAATPALTIQQQREDMRAGVIADRMEAISIADEPDTLTCKGSWRFRSGSGHSFTLRIDKLRYVFQPDGGDASSGTVLPSDATTSLLISDDPLTLTGIDQHFMDCRGNAALMNGLHDREIALERVPDATR